MGRGVTRQAKERQRRDELLSAYLDGQLSAGERARLEARLATDPSLRAELDALRRTVALVRDLPSLPLPRNFILPQTMAPRTRPAPPVRRRRAWAAPLLTAATAVVSLMFAFVLAVDLLSPAIGSVAPAPMAELATQEEAPRIALAPSPVGEKAVLEEEAAEAEAEVEVTVEVEEAVPAPAAAEMPAEEAPKEAPEEAAPESLEEVEDHAAEALESEGVPEPSGGGGVPEEPAAPAPPAGLSATETPAAPPSRLAVEEEEPTPAPEPTVIAGANGLEDAAVPPAPAAAGEALPQMTGEEEPGAEEAWQGVPEREVTVRRGISPRRAVVALLGLALLGLALATVRAWRVRR